MIYLKSFHGIVGKKVTRLTSHNGHERMVIVFDDDHALVLSIDTNMIDTDPSDETKKALNLPSQREIDAAKTKEAKERMQLAILKTKYETGAPS